MEKCITDKHEKIRNKLIDSAVYGEQVRQAGKIFSLLGDESRMKILLALIEGELCVYHICDITGNKQSATSQHLRKLKDGKIVKSRKVGNQVLYSLDDDHIVTILKTALAHIEHEKE